MDAKGGGGVEGGGGSVNENIVVNCQKIFDITKCIPGIRLKIKWTVSDRTELIAKVNVFMEF